MKVGSPGETALTPTRAEAEQLDPADFAALYPQSAYLESLPYDPRLRGRLARERPERPQMRRPGLEYGAGSGGLGKQASLE